MQANPTSHHLGKESIRRLTITRGDAEPLPAPDDWILARELDLLFLTPPPEPDGEPEQWGEAA